MDSLELLKSLAGTKQVISVIVADRNKTFSDIAEVSAETLELLKAHYDFGVTAALNAIEDNTNILAVVDDDAALEGTVSDDLVELNDLAKVYLDSVNN